MTKLLHIFAALLLVAAASGCRRDTHALERMEHTEAIMAAHPDSALAIMEAIDPGALRTDRARALHALLLTQARDKNYIDQTDDSLILVAADYYGTTNNQKYEMISYFYLGRIQKYAKRFPDATTSLHKSETIAKELCDSFYLSQIYGDLNDIFGEVFSASLELKYANMACDYVPFNENAYKAWAKYEVARALQNNRRPQEADSILDEISAEVEVMASEPELQSQILILKSRCKFAMKQFPETTFYLDSLLRYNSSYYTAQDAQNHIIACYASDDYIKGDSLINTKLRPHGIEAPSYIYACRNDYLNAYQSLKKEYDSFWKWFDKSILQEATLASENYHIMALNDEEQKSDGYLNMIILISFLSIFSLIIVFLIFKSKIEIERRKKAELQLLAANLKKDRETLERTNKGLSSHVNALFGEQFKAIDSLSRIIYEYKGLKNESTQLSAQARKILKSFDGNNTNQKLTELIDRYLDGLASDFQKDFPNTSDTDNMLFLYLVCKFSVSSIAMFLGKTPSVIYNHKSRLKAKIAESLSTRKNEYMQIFG